jgi:hypothetical protein
VFQALGFGTVDKIFLKFPRRWWSELAEDGFSLLWTDDEQDEELPRGWPRAILGFYSNPTDKKSLCAWMSGPGAREMESKPLDEVERVCMQLLRKFTRNLGVKVPDPVRVLRSVAPLPSFVLSPLISCLVFPHPRLIKQLKCLI